MRRELTPAPRGDTTDILMTLAPPVFIALCAVLWTHFNFFGDHPFLLGALRSYFFISYLYWIMFVFDGRGARTITERFVTSFLHISIVYFIAVCPIETFTLALLICSVFTLALYSHFFT
jgi:hypothetical protein